MDRCRVLLRQSSDARCALLKCHRYNFITAVQCSTKLIVFLTWASRVRFLRDHSFSPLRKPKPSPILPDFPCRSLSSSARTLQILPKESTHLELPASLEQHYAICSLKSKIDVLWSFIKSHLQSKTLIFLSFMRFIFEAFRRLHPGTPLLHMHGQQSSRCSIRAWRR